jgi:hypothetical protein
LALTRKLKEVGLSPDEVLVIASLDWPLEQK